MQGTVDCLCVGVGLPQNKLKWQQLDTFKYSRSVYRYMHITVYVNCNTGRTSHIGLPQCGISMYMYISPRRDNVNRSFTVFLLLGLSVYFSISIFVLGFYSIQPPICQIKKLFTLLFKQTLHKARPIRLAVKPTQFECTFQILQHHLACLLQAYRLYYMQAISRAYAAHRLNKGVATRAKANVVAMQ